MSKIALLSLALAGLALTGCSSNNANTFNGNTSSSSRLTATRRVDCPPGGTFQMCNTLTVLPAEPSTATAMRLRY